MLALPTTPGNTGQDGIYEFQSTSNGIFALASAQVTRCSSASAAAALTVSNLATGAVESLDASVSAADPALDTAGGSVSLLAPPDRPIRAA